jgi:hypothetical protein
MPARLSVEDLQPASVARRAAARTRRRFQGARVERDLRLAPRDAGGILDLALEALLARFGAALGVALLVWVPFRQITELLGLSGGTLVLFGWNLLELVPRAITESVAVSLVVDALQDRRAPAQASIRRGLVRAPGVVLLIAITQYALMPLVFLLVVPFLLAQWLTWAALPIYVLEGDALLTQSERAAGRRHPLVWLANVPRRVGRALVRSVRLSLGGPALGRWFLIVIVSMLLLAGLSELAVVAVTYPASREVLRDVLGIGGATAEFALGAVGATLTALTACVRAALMATYYLDLRVRREGWDLELRLRGEHAEAR